MDQTSLNRLARGMKLHESSRSRKLLAAPLRMGSSILLRKLCAWRSKPLRTSARTFWGDTMELIYPDGVSIGIYQFGYFEAGLTAIFLERVKPGMTVFDVGAHFGYFTLLSSHLVGEGGHVHSFEPTPATFEVLRANVARRPNVTINPLAVFSHETTLSLTSYESLPSFNTVGRGNVADADQALLKTTTFDVQATSLDHYVASTGARPDLIKLDAEGAEEQIFKGMERVMTEIRPLITLEVGDITEGAAGKSRALVQLFLSLDYQAWEYDPARRATVPHTLRETYDYDNLLLVPQGRRE
jgi:FkbM family methyltransferase